MKKGLYKEYQYEKIDSVLRVYIPKYYKDEIKGIKNLTSARYWGKTVGVWEEEDFCVSIVPWRLFVNCVNLTKVEFPSHLTGFPEYAKSILLTESDRQILDEIDLLLNPIGFYK